MSPETLYCTSKCTKMRLVAGLRPDPLESLQRSPDPLAELKGREGDTGGGRKGRGDGRGSGEGKGRTPIV